MLALLLAACSGGEQAADISVTDVWARPSPTMAANGAFYMNIHNNGSASDRLIDAASDACGTVELHETMMENSVMQMRHKQEIPIPPGQTVALEVGGLHVMCLDKQADFTPGSRIPLTLIFANAGELVVEAEIREQ